MVSETVAHRQLSDHQSHRQRAVGLEINANHIRSKRDGWWRSVPVHVGRSTLVWDIRIYDEEEKLVCISRCTMAVVDNER